MYILESAVLVGGWLLDLFVELSPSGSLDSDIRLDFVVWIWYVYRLAL